MKTIRLVDLSGCFWPQWRAKAGEDIDAAANGTLNAIRRFARGCDHVAICCDRGPYFRREIAAQFTALVPDYKGYKGTRPEKDLAALAQLERVQRELRAEGFPLFEAKGYEADDIIATMAEWAVARGDRVEILSEDKDVRCLVRPTVSVIRRSDEVVDEKAVLDRFGVAPSRIPEYLAIVGDPDDGVLGVHGLGKDRVPGLFAKFGDFMAAHARAVDEQADVERETAERAAMKETGQKLPPLAKREFTPAMRQNIITGARYYEIGLALTTLRTDAPIDCERVLADRAPPPDVVRSAEMDALLAAAHAEAEEEEAAAIAAALNDNARKTEETMNTANPVIADAEFTETPKPADRPSEPQAAKPQQPDPFVKAPSEVAQPATTAAPQPPQNQNTTGPAKPDTVKKDALATAGPPRPFSEQLEARNLSEANWLAQSIAASKKIKDAGDVNSVLLKLAVGRSLGMSLYQCLRLYLMEGQVTMRAQQVLARVKSSPLCEYIRVTQLDDESCSIKTKRRGEPEQSYTFTIAKARRAMLGGIKVPGGDFDPQSAWAKWPEDMLFARTLMPLVRREYPELVDGYAAEELGDDPRANSIDTTGEAA